ncbi:hypothetical protein ABW21_db0201944 [Orbilia brochopaga]|nr:hypothetical protein ABW21_db0201944 [Drechslerella brochopaga]
MSTAITPLCHSSSRAADSAGATSSKSMTFFEAQDIYAVLQRVSSNRKTTDPRIFGSSMFTRQRKAISDAGTYHRDSYNEEDLGGDECWEADPDAIESLAFRIHSLSTSPIEGEANVRSSRAGSHYSFGTTMRNESLDSRFAALAITTSSSTSSKSSSVPEPRRHKMTKKAPSLVSAQTRRRI